MFNNIFTHISSGIVQQGAKLNVLQTQIEDWQSVEYDTHIGGGHTELIASSTNVSAWGGATSIYRRFAIAQKSTIRKINVRLYHAQITTFKLKLFRYNYDLATYVFVSEVSLTSTASNSVQTIDLPTPMYCEIGDILGVYLPSTNHLYGEYQFGQLGKLSISSSDVTATNDFSTATEGTHNMCPVDAFGNQRPYLAIVGDSIFEGNDYYQSQLAVNVLNGVNTWPGGNASYEIWHHLNSLIPQLRYQNFARGGAQWNTAVGAVTKALTVNPRALILGFGTNDITVGTNDLSAALAVMDDVKILVDASTVEKLYVCSILPRTDGDDVAASTRRTWNNAYKDWCATNGATYIDAYNAMGKIRQSTGYYDDLKDEYVQFSVHLTPVGADAYANIIYHALK